MGISISSLPLMKYLGLNFRLVCQWPQTPTGSLRTSPSPTDNVLVWNTSLFCGPPAMNWSTSVNGPCLSLKMYGIAQHPMCIDPVPSWQQTPSIWCAQHESLYHTGSRVDENRLHLPINFPVCSALAISTASNNPGRSIDNYGVQERAGIAIGPPHLDQETAWTVLGWRK